MIIEAEGKGSISIDKSVYNLFQRFNEKITTEDSEVWGAYIGDNGAGKSLRAMHDAFSMNQKLLPIKHICFDKDEFIKAVLGAEKGDVIIADEGISIFFNRSSMTREGRLIAELVDQIRQKNLAIFLCIRRLLAVDESLRDKLRFVCYCWEDRKQLVNKIVTYKGNAAYYIHHTEMPQVQLLINYLKVKRKNPMLKIRRPEPFLYHMGGAVGEGYKPPFYPILEGKEAYIKKKREIIDKYKPKEKEIVLDEKTLKSKVIYDLKNKGMSFRQISDSLDIPKSTIADYYHKYVGILSEQKHIV